MSKRKKFYTIQFEIPAQTGEIKKKDQTNENQGLVARMELT